MINTIKNLFRLVTETGKCLEVFAEVVTDDPVSLQALHA